MERVICLVIGYVLGLFQTGYFYGRMNNIDIRQYGSGNSGTTNALRVLGKKAGLIVFAGDFLKTVLACALARILFADKPEMVSLLVVYAGFGAVLGHNYPFYLNFKGGKGIAATSGLIFFMDWRTTVICLILFIGAVAITRFVSLGSLLVVTAMCITFCMFAAWGDFGLGAGYLYEFYGVTLVLTALAYWRHRANIVRLLHGTENKLGAKK